MNDFPRASPEVCGRHRTAHGTSARWPHQRVATVVCGGLGGIMEAVAKGAVERNGVVVGLLPLSGNAHFRRRSSLRARFMVRLPSASAMGASTGSSREPFQLRPLTSRRLLK
jgi:hypothetical protein